MKIKVTVIEDGNREDFVVQTKNVCEQLKMKSKTEKIYGSFGEAKEAVDQFLGYLKAGD